MRKYIKKQQFYRNYEFCYWYLKCNFRKNITSEISGGKSDWVGFAGGIILSP